MYNVSETILPIYINGQCPIIKTCSDVTLNLSSKDSTVSMEGDLSKKSIHINESFVHAIYIGIVVNSYSDIVAYI